MSGSKHNQEEEYFARLEREQLAALKEKLAIEEANAAREERKALHKNRCGKCGGELKPRPFKGVEIDVCVDCGAVLLDPGELEQLAGDDKTGVFSALGELFSFTRQKG